MRQFEFTLNHGRANILKTTATIYAETVHQALNVFCKEMGCHAYLLVSERPVTQNDKLYSVWSTGCDLSGQRIYVKECIG